MKDYASMSDFEINSAVHNALLDKPYELTFHGGGKITWKDKDSGMVIETGIVGYTKNGLHDYCNNPEDAWSIILQNRISVIFDSSDESDESEESDEWVKACVGGEEYFISYHYCHRALRAAMVAFLMMKDGEK